MEGYSPGTDYAVGFPGGSVVKNLPAKQEMGVRSLGREDPLEKGMATTPIFLPGKSHGQRTLEGCSPQGHRVRHNLATKQQQPQTVLQRWGEG